MHNPSLKEEPRKGKPTVVPSLSSVAILDWLKQQGRLIEHSPDPTVTVAPDDIEDIDDLIGDDGYDDEDFDVDED